MSDSPIVEEVGWVTSFSYEREAIDYLAAVAKGFPQAKVYRGQGAANRFDVPGWNLPVLQRFQFGDFRLETPGEIIIVETESAGGVTNLVKYWPFLASGAVEKRLILLHLFQVASEGDYIAHRRLWGYLVERMKEDLQMRCGVLYGQHWEAHLFTYRSLEELEAIQHLLQERLAGR